MKNKIKRKNITKFLNDKKVRIDEVEHKGGEISSIFMKGVPLGSSQSKSFVLIIRGYDHRKK